MGAHACCLCGEGEGDSGFRHAVVLYYHGGGRVAVPTCRHMDCVTVFVLDGDKFIFKGHFALSMCD